MCLGAAGNHRLFGEIGLEGGIIQTTSGTCKECFPTNSKCDGNASHPCCDSNAICNTTRTSGSTKYCLLPAGSGTSYLFNNWVKMGQGSFMPDHDVVRSGATSVKISSGYPASYIKNAVLGAALRGNRNYQLEFWARGELQNDKIRYAIVDVANSQYLDANGNWNPNVNGAEVAITKPLTTSFARTIQAFTTTSGAVIELRFYTTTNNEMVYLDDVSISEISDFTMTAWVKPSASQGNYARLFYKLGQESGNEQGFDWLFNSANTLSMGFYSSNETGAQTQVIPTLDLSDGNWHMVSISVRRNGNYSAYLDNRLVSSGPFRLGRMNNSEMFLIGAQDTEGSNGFRGMIDEVRFYRRALSQSEIENHYNGLYQDKCGLELEIRYKPSTATGSLSANYNAELRLRRQLPDTVLSLPFDIAVSSDQPGMITDYSRLLSHGTKTGATWTQNGKFGGAYVFAHPTDKITVPSSVLSGSGDFTMGAWVKPTMISGNHYILGNANASYDGVQLAITGDMLRLQVGFSSLSGGTLPEGEWTHVAAVRQAGEAKVYLNGQMALSSPIEGNIGSSGNFIIGNSYSSSAPFYGTIDEVRVFSRALSDAELKSLYNESMTVSSRPLGTSQG